MRAHEKALVGLVALTLMLSGCSGPKPEQTVKEFFEAFRLADTARMESLLIFRDGVEFDLDSDMGSAEVTPEQIDVVRRLFSSVPRCMDCAEYDCGKASVGWKPAIEARSISAGDVTWAILPYVDGQYGN